MSLNTEHELRRRESGRWFALSVALHVVVFALLIYFTPLRDLMRFEEPTRPQRTMSGDEIEQLSESIEERVAESIRDNVQELRRTLEEMERIEAQMDVEFTRFDRRQKQQAARDALKEMTEAVARMDEAIDSIEADADIETTDRHQALAEQAQERARKKLDMSPIPVAEALEHHAQAERVHRQAKSQHDRKRDAELKRKGVEVRIETEAKAKLEKEQAELESARTAEAKAVEALQAARKDLEAAQADNDKARQAKANLDSESPSDEKRRAAKEAREASEHLKKSKRALDHSERARDGAERRVRAKAADVEEALGRVKELQGQAKEYEQQRQARAKASAEAQKKAKEAQVKAIKALEKSIAAHASQVQTASGEADGDGGATTQTVSSTSSEDSTKDQDVAELYDAGKSAEDAVAEKLKEVRARDLAMVRRITLDKARDDIDVVRPVRPDLDEELLRDKPRTDETFEAHKEELKKALRETTSMVNLAHQMLEMARQSAEGLKFGVSAEAAPEQMEEAELALRIDELAMEDVSGDYSDLTQVMKMAAPQPAEQAPPQQMRRGEDYEDLTAEQLEEGKLLELGADGEDVGGVPALTPDTPMVAAQRLGAVGRRAKWLYLDTWYTIGPWPNPARRNIDRQYPPNTLIDLDATYTTEAGRQVRWQFVQSDGPRVTPADAREYGIWYAYAELRMDEARDVLVAVGSDDRGILEINGVRVWISSKRLKGWDIDEAWRKVHLRKGINRFLFRLENGWLQTGFSVVIRVPGQ